MGVLAAAIEKSAICLASAPSIGACFPSLIKTSIWLFPPTKGMVPHKQLMVSLDQQVAQVLSIIQPVTDSLLRRNL